MGDKIWHWNLLISLGTDGQIFTYNSHRSATDATDEVITTVEQAGGRAVAVKLDTEDIAAFPGFVAEIRKFLADLSAERFDFLVNNAKGQLGPDQVRSSSAVLPTLLRSGRGSCHQTIYSFDWPLRPECRGPGLPFHPDRRL